MAESLNRNEFLRVLAGGLAAGALPAAEVQTHTYKRVWDCEIRADVHGADGTRRPVVIWIHGGALILGSRALRPGQARRIPAITDLFLQAGYVVVSIDYRLAPETKLPAIIEDLQDAHKWVREKGPKLFGADPDRIAVSGGSAGGYLTLMTGCGVEPRPRALVSLFGYGDIAGPWYSRPDPFYSRQPAVPKEEAYAAVGSRELSEGSGNRGRFYLYCRQQGRWPQEVAGRDPDAEPRWFDRYCPIRNVSAKYSPTVLIHGDQDTDVPYEQSAAMAKELARHKVPQEFITIPGGGHGFGGYRDPRVVIGAFERAVAFVKNQTGTDDERR